MPTSVPPLVQLLPDSDLLCFVVPSAFSSDRCAELLARAVGTGFQATSTHYPTYYRNNERLVVDDEQLAQQLFAAIRPVLPPLLPADEPGAPRGICGCLIPGSGSVATRPASTSIATSTACTTNQPRCSRDSRS